MKRMVLRIRLTLLAAVICPLLMVMLLGCARGDVHVGVDGARERLRVATTTSMYDTGLWEVIEARYEQQYGIRLDVVYAGTGIALEYGRRGDVDVIAVHDKVREEQFIAEGYGIERVPFAYNYFVIVGPGDDPAGLADLQPEQAFTRLYQSQRVPFISRGDDSGTHVKEKAIWKAAGLDYEEVRTSGAWYIERGGGMGPTLLMAAEKQAYALSDIGTFLAYQGDTGLITLVEKDSIMLNVYSAIVIPPEITSAARYDRAQTLIDFLVSPEVQELIGEYGTKDFGRPLFAPCAGAEPKS